MNFNIVLKNESIDKVEVYYSSEDIDIKDIGRMGIAIIDKMDVENSTLVQYPQGQGENWKGLFYRVCAQIFIKVRDGLPIPKQWEIRTH